MSRPVIYISGPYTANSSELTQANVERAKEAGYRVRDLGATPLVPHIAVLQPNHKDPEAVWGQAMEDCLAFLKSCDGVLMMEGWERSRGAKIELVQAEEWGLPVYFSEASLAERLRWSA